MYKHLFGPVPSRRLGISLGVDLVPHKTCSLDCIYCECGQTTNLTLERAEYVPLKEVLLELEDYFQNHPAPDYITFSGSGEPTLHVHLGEVVNFIKKKQPDVAIAVLTNGTLLHKKDVREALSAVDLVMPSLDGATVSSFTTINRPPAAIDIETYISGLVDFRAGFRGKFGLEIFILPGCNDSEEELGALKLAVEKINPDIIQLNTLDRPGVVADIHSADRKQLEEIASFFRPLPVEIIAAAPRRKEVSSYRDDMEAAILETVMRRPCTLEDLSTILGSHINEINKYLASLEEAGKIEAVRLKRGLFYQAKDKFSEK